MPVENRVINISDFMRQGAMPRDQRLIESILEKPISGGGGGKKRATARNKGHQSN